MNPANNKIHSYRDCQPLIGELHDILSEKEYQGLQDPLSDRIYRWSFRLTALSKSTPETVVEKMQLAFQELQSEILVSRINLEQAPIRLNDPVLSQNLSILVADGSKLECRAKKVEDLDLTWERGTLEIFKKAHDKYFAGKEGIQIGEHPLAKQMLFWASGVHFEREDNNQGPTLTEDDIKILGDLKRLGSQEKLGPNQAKKLEIFLLQMSIPINFVASEEFRELIKASGEALASSMEELHAELQGVNNKHKIAALKSQIEHEEIILESLQKQEESFNKTVNNLNENIEKEVKEGEEIRSEQAKVEEEIPILNQKQKDLDEKMKVSQAKLQQRINACNKTRNDLNPPGGEGSGCGGGCVIS